MKSICTSCKHKDACDRDRRIIGYPNFRVEKAVDYIKGYCRKHPNCSEHCRLYDIESGRCIFFDGFDGLAGPPRDWELPKREEEENGEE